MNKRYQVFVSSTYTDLQGERGEVARALMEMDCIPAGMEWFPAADEEQFVFIQRVIDDCDYYVLIVGGRYGTLSASGLSFTEREYEYALSKGIPILAFLHENPAALAVAKSDTDPALSAKLASFRNKVGAGRLVKFWKSADQLAGIVALALMKAIKMHPAVGWVRGSEGVASAELLSEINELRKANDELKDRAKSAMPVRVADLARMDEVFNLTGIVFKEDDTPGYRRFDLPFSWAELFGLLSPAIRDSALLPDVIYRLKLTVCGRTGALRLDHVDIPVEMLDTIEIQFIALGLVEVKRANTTWRWSLTEHGYATMISLRAVRTAVQGQAHD